MCLFPKLPISRGESVTRSTIFISATEIFFGTPFVKMPAVEACWGGFVCLEVLLKDVLSLSSVHLNPMLLK